MKSCQKFGQYPKELFTEISHAQRDGHLRGLICQIFLAQRLIRRLWPIIY